MRILGGGGCQYAVKTTGIFYRPSCKSRATKKDNVHIFYEAEQAFAEGFRPCKRCKPGGLRLPDEEWVVQMTTYIDKHFNEFLTLEILADVCHGSPYHLHRTFKRIKGITPVEYIQNKRMKEAIRYLTTTNKSPAKIGLEVGIPNISYFITLFKKKTGNTPAYYRKIHQ
ncbi:helix-turn-helix domain-containing protein [Bacillus sp. 03113]|uniref:helix-turn-helix domain-containing protein n=1 Tax=Bacillus sp. 03113 TaxID=2578211 RepID=UPI002852EA80|nr:helix-turn-helix domain-containing protein [Bacillus sp. 03113]